MFFPEMGALGERMTNAIKIVYDDISTVSTIKTKDMGLLDNPECGVIIRSSELFELPDQSGRPFGFIIEVSASLLHEDFPNIYSLWEPDSQGSEDVGILVTVKWNPVGQKANAGSDTVLKWFSKNATAYGFPPTLFNKKIQFFPYEKQDELIQWLEFLLNDFSSYVFIARTIGR